MPLSESAWTFSVTAGVAGFQEAYFASARGTSKPGRRWGDYAARVARYEAYWALYESNVYRAIHQFAEGLKSQFDLYPRIRSVYSPAYRVGEFWASHIWGGGLDSAAGDGVAVPSALPIRGPTTVEALRPALAALWRASTWQIYKETLTRFGAVMGDVGLQVVDDEARREVQLRVVHPSTIRDVTLDPRGNVKSYVLMERRPDPEWDLAAGTAPDVNYLEICDRVGRAVRFRTYRNGELYDWRDYPAGVPDSARVGPEWTQDYGFVPFVLFRHRGGTGQDWGWSELHPSLSRFHELDSLASNLHDQVGINVRAVWLLTGFEKPPVLTLPDGPGQVPMVSTREVSARAQPLVAPVDLAAGLAAVRALADEVERNHPELQADLQTASGDASGRALRIARERVDRMVRDRRAVYDDGLVRAHMMVFSIGAAKQYPGSEGLPPDGFERGLWEHEIGDRPVFATGEVDRLEEERNRALAARAWVEAGLPLAAALARVGLAEEDVAAVLAARDVEDRAKEDSIRRRQALAFEDLAPADESADAGDVDRRPDELMVGGNGLG